MTVSLDDRIFRVLSFESPFLEEDVALEAKTTIVWLLRLVDSQ